MFYKLITLLHWCVFGCKGNYDRTSKSNNCVSVFFYFQGMKNYEILALILLLKIKNDNALPLKWCAKFIMFYKYWHENFCSYLQKF